MYARVKVFFSLSYTHTHTFILCLRLTVGEQMIIRKKNKQNSHVLSPEEILQANLIN